MMMDRGMVDLHAALDKAGVPMKFRRFQPPVMIPIENDLKWWKFAASMWKRSYEVSDYTNRVLRNNLRKV